MIVKEYKKYIYAYIHIYNIIIYMIYDIIPGNLVKYTKCYNKPYMMTYLRFIGYSNFAVEKMSQRWE